MRSKIFTLCTAIFITAALSTLADAQKVSYYSPPGTSFGQYKTYTWERAEKATYPERAVDDAFVRSIDAELAKKGLRRVESEDAADLIATYQIAVIADMEWSSGHSRIPWQGMATGTVGLQGGPVGGTHTIQKGSFIFDLYDVKAKRQVWQVHATKTLDDTMDPNKRQRNIQKAMAKVFKGYPSS